MHLFCAFLASGVHTKRAAPDSLSIAAKTWLIPLFGETLIKIIVPSFKESKMLTKD